VLRAVSVSLLRGTIRVLEFAVEKLEGAPPAQGQPAANAQSPAESIAGSTTGQPGSATPQPTVPAAADTPPAPAKPGLLTELRLLWEDIQTLWSKILPQIRRVLPASLNQLSDTALTGGIAGVLLLLVWVSSALPGKSPAATGTEPAPQPVAIRSPEPIVEPLPEPIVEPAAEEFAEEPAAPAVPEPAPLPELTAPAPEQPIEVSPAGESGESLPPLDLTPEQSLIAAIQDQVTQITNQYADGLIQSIQANFRSSRLIVKVDESWYELARSRQDRIATEMLERARELDFSKLEITDSEGTLLARSPVVGSEMIIFKRDL
jgi:hypothetical protein